nr:MAG TPA: hypothetical protein [Caudoviricetes sp.]
MVRQTAPRQYRVQTPLLATSKLAAVHLKQMV